MAQATFGIAGLKTFVISTNIDRDLTSSPMTNAALVEAQETLDKIQAILNQVKTENDLQIKARADILTQGTANWLKEQISADQCPLCVMLAEGPDDGSLLVCLELVPTVSSVEDYHQIAFMNAWVSRDRAMIDPKDQELSALVDQILQDGVRELYFNMVANSPRIIEGQNVNELIASGQMINWRGLSLKNVFRWVMMAGPEVNGLLNGRYLPTQNTYLLMMKNAGIEI